MQTSLSTWRQGASDTALPANSAFLRANSASYEWLVGKIEAMDRKKEAESVLNRVAAAAGFAAAFHAGRFADGAIENIAFEIGAERRDLVTGDGGVALPVRRTGRYREVLHVASHMVEIAGHARMLHRWVRNDQSSCHSLVLVNQREMPIPKWLYQAFQTRGGQLMVFPPGSHIYQKARWLREAARRNADLVVLHHDGHDVVPTVAFATDDCPPVAVLNHADHQFWLGSSVTDIVINLRAAAAEHTAARRYVSSNSVIPIPLSDPVDRLSRGGAREALGIGNDQLVLLSVGRAEKYRPCGTYNFVATAGRILDSHPSAHLYVVGESAAGIAPYLRCPVHDRLHFVGAVQDPSLYRSAAEIYLESFPFGSNTALLEAALSGLPVVPAYAPLFPLLVAGNDVLEDLLPNAHNEQEYVERVQLLIQRPERRADLGATLRKRLLIEHVGEGWLDRLAAIYQKTDHLTHRPQPIPVSQCSAESEADISLSLWHVVADGKTYVTGTPTDAVGAAICHSAFVAREVGDYANARRNAWRALRHDPHWRASWRLLGVALLGRAAKTIRRALNMLLNRG